MRGHSLLGLARLELTAHYLLTRIPLNFEKFDILELILARDS